MADDLVQFLRDRLDEDEEAARTASKYASAEWHVDEEYGETVLWWPPEPRVAEAERRLGMRVVSDTWRGQTIEALGSDIAPHIARWDPERVLTEVDAKRRIVKRHSRRRAPSWDRPGHIGYECAQCTNQFPCPTLRLLALPFASHSAYRPDWVPDA